MLKVIIDAITTFFRNVGNIPPVIQPNADSPPPPLPASTSYYYADSAGNPIGLFSLSDLQLLVQSGTINDAIFVIEEGGTEWKTYSTIAQSPPAPPPLIVNQIPQSVPLRWPSVLAMFFCYPVGLIVLWLSKGYDQSQKWIITAVSGGSFLLAILTNMPGWFALAMVVNGFLFIKWSRKSVLERVAFSALVVVFSFGVLVSLMDANHSKESNAPAAISSNSDDTAPPSPAEPEPKPPSIYLYDEFRLGDFTYEVTRVVRMRQLGDEFTQVMPSRGGVFLIVTYKITNNSNETQTVLSDDFTLRDSQGREFRPSSEANTALMEQGNGKDFILSELQPGLTKTTQTAFEIPSESSLDSSVLVIPEKGWGGDKREVLLTSKPNPHAN